MSITFVFDATHQNINSLPPNQMAALYTTGSLDIKATPQDFANHPNALRICQDNGSDLNADILDMEFGAATPQDCAQWLPRARNEFNTAVRKGQRWPGVYASQSRLTELANVLVAAHISSVPLWVANWSMDQATAIAELLAASGPFPIVGFQIRNQVVDDFSVFSTAYLDTVSSSYPARQIGVVQSITTHRSAKVETNDGGKTWLYVGV